MRNNERRCEQCGNLMEIIYNKWPLMMEYFQFQTFCQYLKIYFADSFVYLRIIQIMFCHQIYQFINVNFLRKATKRPKKIKGRY